MRFKTFSSNEIDQLIGKAKFGDLTAKAVLRVLASCDDDECRTCGTVMSRHNRLSGYIVAFVDDNPGADFGIRPICQRCVAASGSIEAVLHSILMPVAGAA